MANVIVVGGCDERRQIMRINIEVEMFFSKEIYGTPMARRKEEELKEKLEAIVLEYFENENSIISDILSSREWAQVKYGR